MTKYYNKIANIWIIKADTSDCKLWTRIYYLTNYYNKLFEESKILFPTDTKLQSFYFENYITNYLILSQLYIEFSKKYNIDLPCLKMLGTSISDSYFYYKDIYKEVNNDK